MRKFRKISCPILLLLLSPLLEAAPNPSTEQRTHTQKASHVSQTSSKLSALRESLIVFASTFLFILLSLWGYKQWQTTNPLQPLFSSNIYEDKKEPPLENLIQKIAKNASISPQSSPDTTISQPKNTPIVDPTQQALLRAIDAHTEEKAFFDTLEKAIASDQTVPHWVSTCTQRGYIHILCYYQHTSAKSLQDQIKQEDPTQKLILAAIPAYHHLVQQSHVEIVKLLIKAGANLDWENRGESALIKLVQLSAAASDADEPASKAMILTLIDLLIAGKANLDLQNEKKETALILSARFGQTAIAQKLITAGANLDLQNKQGKTALMMAFLMTNLPIADLLLDHNAHTLLQVPHPSLAYAMYRQALDFAETMRGVDLAQKDRIIAKLKNKIKLQKKDPAFKVDT